MIGWTVVATLGCAIGDGATGPGGAPELGDDDTGTATGGDSLESTGEGQTSISDSTGSDADGSTSGPPVGSDEGPTGPGGFICGAAILEETFAVSGLEESPDWTTGGSGNVSSQAVGGVLEIDIDGGFWTAEALVQVPEVGAIGLELVEAPLDPPGLVWIGLMESGHEVYIDVYEGSLRASFRNPGDSGYTIADDLPYDPGAHRFLRLRYDAAQPTAMTQTSPDGVTWNDFAALDVTMMDISNAQVGMGAALSGGAAASPATVVDDILLCAGA